ncbi:uncharacterized protein EHS24_002247 [Apiotrichum porosum]|uniref:BRCT domain-containing protein n=1 Tax=Apiotrichum porosum TaxID=105984 RepID=A0A427XI66_9TREE|nr:uncharacterized protein EHS24_002247 [Apiotrichum porosum]RSH78522.1 hypothetical protein EHS24_002247 [Apiotrichum porosum]
MSTPTTAVGATPPQKPLSGFAFFMQKSGCLPQKTAEKVILIVRLGGQVVAYPLDLVTTHIVAWGPSLGGKDTPGQIVYAPKAPLPVNSGEDWDLDRIVDTFCTSYGDPPGIRVVHEGWLYEVLNRKALVDDDKWLVSRADLDLFLPRQATALPGLVSGMLADCPGPHQTRPPRLPSSVNSPRKNKKRHFQRQRPALPRAAILQSQQPF